VNGGFQRVPTFTRYVMVLGPKVKVEGFTKLDKNIVPQLGSPTDVREAGGSTPPAGRACCPAR
jgi:hypothetical protein